MEGIGQERDVRPRLEGLMGRPCGRVMYAFGVASFSDTDDVGMGAYGLDMNDYTFNIRHDRKGASYDVGLPLSTGLCVLAVAVKNTPVKGTSGNRAENFPQSVAVHKRAKSHIYNFLI
ncbi:hypothetical protein EYC84_005891 [Monilinia fructicola]|uniref:Uncharacterized protein n=1 Tax=Monilinia fructicola TaxID=38448 RepID=A0A5M9K355_MONFR|nr:hypothetical protein EYC84_005891 [Monilinia fructicola]